VVIFFFTEKGLSDATGLMKQSLSVFHDEVATALSHHKSGGKFTP
jgi:hypothetical protein